MKISDMSDVRVFGSLGMVPMVYLRGQTQLNHPDRVGILSSSLLQITQQKASQVMDFRIFITSSISFYNPVFPLG